MLYEPTIWKQAYTQTRNVKERQQGTDKDQSSKGVHQCSQQSSPCPPPGGGVLGGLRLFFLLFSKFATMNV